MDPVADFPSPVIGLDVRLYGACTDPAHAAAAASPAGRQHPSLLALADGVNIAAQFLLLKDLSALCACGRGIWRRLARDEELWTRAWQRVVDARFSPPLQATAVLCRRFPHLAYNFKLPDLQSMGVQFDFPVSLLHVQDLSMRLPGCGKLRSLCFDHAGLEDAHVALLAGALRASCVSAVHIGNQGVANSKPPPGNLHLLFGIQSITNLSLISDNIADKHALDMASALRANSTLKTLVLWGNLITDVGALALLGALKACALARLNVFENRISESVLARIRASLRI
jgi:hypothetical protein